jgi:isoaspartyl peptidase/L-asparaginase-like protein (Ntn-hydrolase superfamily)
VEPVIVVHGGAGRIADANLEAARAGVHAAAAAGQAVLVAGAVAGETASLGTDVTCGLIVLDPRGRIGIAHESEHMSHAWARGEAAVHAAIGLGRP